MATKRGAEAPCPGGVDTGTEANTTRRGQPRCPLAAAEGQVMVTQSCRASREPAHPLDIPQYRRPPAHVRK